MPYVVSPKASLHGRFRCMAQGAQDAIRNPSRWSLSARMMLSSFAARAVLGLPTLQRSGP